MLKTIKRIICPVDVYDFQPEVAEYALTLSNALGAEITVVYVQEPSTSRYFGKGGLACPSFAKEEEARRRAETKMKGIISGFFNPRMGSGEVLLGQTTDQIVRIADECSADMIIMTNHGRPRLNRVLHTSATNKVLASTKKPVLVIQPLGG